MSPRCFPDNVCPELSALMEQYAERLGVPRDQCEDVVQDAWVHALVSDVPFHGEHALEQLHSWFRTIVHNVAVDEFRSLDRQSAASLADLAAEPMDEKEAKRADLAEQMEGLTVYLERLQREDPENGWLVREHCLNGRTIRELAEATSRTPHEISCRIWRGIQKLRSWAAELSSQGKSNSQ